MNRKHCIDRTNSTQWKSTATLQSSNPRPNKCNRRGSIRSNQIARRFFLIQTFELRRKKGPNIHSSKQWAPHTQKRHKRSIKRTRNPLQWSGWKGKLKNLAFKIRNAGNKSNCCLDTLISKRLKERTGMKC